MKKENLMKLYQGSLLPWQLEDDIFHPHLKERTLIYAEAEEAFMNKIPVNLYKEFEQVCNLRYGVGNEDLAAHFFEGFTIGLRIAVECLYDEEFHGVCSNLK